MGGGSGISGGPRLAIGIVGGGPVPGCAAMLGGGFVVFGLAAGGAITWLLGGLEMGERARFGSMVLFRESDESCLDVVRREHLWHLKGARSQTVGIH